MESEEIEVIVVDDHLSVRRGLELLLRDEGFRIVGTAARLDEARGVLEKRHHDAVLMDVNLGREDTLELVAERRREDPGSAIVLYTGDIGPGSRLKDAVDLGAGGFVLKSSPPSAVVEALRIVAAGGTYVDPQLATVLAEGVDGRALTHLSPRELEVLELLADGHTGRGVADVLFLSHETVRTHVRNATNKLGAKTRVQAVALVVENRRLGA